MDNFIVKLKGKEKKKRRGGCGGGIGGGERLRG
jgi:hypothetical protein